MFIAFGYGMGQHTVENKNLKIIPKKLGGGFFFELAFCIFAAWCRRGLDLAYS